MRSSLKESSAPPEFQGHATGREAILPQRPASEKGLGAIFIGIGVPVPDGTVFTSCPRAF